MTPVQENDVTDRSMPEAILKMPEALQRMAGVGRISAEDVLTLRRKVFTDGVVQPREAEWLFALNDTCHDNAPEWPAFFVEALVDYTVHQAEPHGYVSPENGQWLVDRISRSGVVKTRTELELLLKVLEQSRQSPDSLVGFALSQVKVAVVEGSGPVRSGASLQPGRIGKAEVELLRRILYAAGGDGNIAVTRTEADITSGAQRGRSAQHRQCAAAHDLQDFTEIPRFGNEPVDLRFAVGQFDGIAFRVIRQDFSARLLHGEVQRREL